ncbi:MAG: hypothetical protein WEA36_10755 [Balneolaceae bacterium]
MKAISLIAILAFLPILASAQGLNRNANLIRSNHPTAYENTIRTHAIEEWENDHAMIVYSINSQADALMGVIRNFKSDNTNILFQAIQNWSHTGYAASNIEKFRELDTVELSQMINLHCNWMMVQYEYDQQVEAKSAY